MSYILNVGGIYEHENAWPHYKELRHTDIFYSILNSTLRCGAGLFSTQQKHVIKIAVLVIIVKILQI